jgi:hypothetical protein
MEAAMADTKCSNLLQLHKQNIEHLLVSCFTLFSHAKSPGAFWLDSSVFWWVSGAYGCIGAAE